MSKKYYWKAKARLKGLNHVLPMGILPVLLSPDWDTDVFSEDGDQWYVNAGPQIARRYWEFTSSEERVERSPGLLGWLFGGE